MIETPSARKCLTVELGAPQRPQAVPESTPETACLSSSVHPGNLSVENHDPDSLTSDFRFRHHVHERDRLLKALPSLDLTEKHRDRFQACGSDAWIQYSQSASRYRVVASSCKLKWCPFCARARAKKVAESIRRLLDTAPRNDWRFVTLTARHTDQPLIEQLKKLKTAFRRMRQRKAWRHHVHYGIAVIETTWNDGTKRWHPHLHLLIAGEYFPKRIIRSEWLASTRNSFIVDIRSLYDADSAATYIAKYLGKPPSDAILGNLEILNEWMQANVASKRIIRFGKAPETAPPPEADDGIADWEPVHRLGDIIAQAQQGNAYAKKIMAILTEKDNAQTERADQNPRHP